MAVIPLASLFETLDMTQGVLRDYASNGTVTVACVPDPSLRVQYESGRVENICSLPLSPESADLFCILGDLQTVGNGKVQIQLLNRLLSLFQRVH